MKKIIMTNNKTSEKEVNILKNDVLNASFLDASSDELVKLISNNKELILKLKGNYLSSKPIITNNTVLYKDIKKNIDLKYELQETRLKESIIINSKETDYDLLFELKIGNLEPRFNEKENALELLDDSKIVYKLLPPFMEDNNGNRNNNCSYEISNDKEGLLDIKLVLDNEWINKEETKLPIVIDPTIEALSIKESGVKRVKRPEKTIYDKIKYTNEFNDGRVGIINFNPINKSIRLENINAKLTSNSLSLSIKHLYDQKKNGYSYGLGNCWKTNLHKSLRVQTRIYECTPRDKLIQTVAYDNTDGNEYVFNEEWYYNDENENKVNVYRRDVYLDGDKLKTKVNGKE